MWFSVSCYPSNSLNPLIEILHVSPCLPVPQHFQTRRYHLPHCKCQGDHFLLSGRVTINYHHIEQCRYRSAIVSMPWNIKHFNSVIFICCSGWAGTRTGTTYPAIYGGTCKIIYYHYCIAIKIII